jgi:Protein of unknown function (DUF4231)
MSQRDPILERLEDQIGWYDKRSGHNQRRFKALKAATLVISVSIPVAAGFGAPAKYAGVLGALVALIEGVQQLNQYQHNWITYRSTCEALKHEKYLFLGNAAPYTAAAESRALLAERVESLVSQEHAKWASTQEGGTKTTKTTGTR